MSQNQNSKQHPRNYENEFYSNLRVHLSTANNEIFIRRRVQRWSLVVLDAI